MTKSLKNPYIALISLLLGAFLLFSFWAARQAVQHGSRIADPDYYSKGLKYTSTQLEKQAAASQGWQLTTAVAQRLITFELADKQQQPIVNAVGELTFYLSDNQKLLHLTPHEISPGSYRVQLPSDLRGSLQARIAFVREGARLSRQLLVNL